MATKKKSTRFLIQIGSTRTAMPQQMRSQPNSKLIKMSQKKLLRPNSNLNLLKEDSTNLENHASKGIIETGTRKEQG